MAEMRRCVPVACRMALTAVVVLMSSLVDADVPLYEYNALTDLYNATNGDAWSITDNWLVGDPCANYWYGVSCDAHHSSVTLLRLHNNSLNGTLPGTIGRLSMLRELQLQSNRLTGTLPSSLGSLSSLEIFYAGDNYLFGEIPSSLFNISRLQYVELYNNSFSGPLPDLLGTMKYLYLYGNLLSGTIPNSYGTLLQPYLEDNRLSGTVPSFFAPGEGPIHWNASMNCFTCPVPSSCADDQCKNRPECHGSCATTYSVTPTPFAHRSSLVTPSPSLSPATPSASPTTTFSNPPDTVAEQVANVAVPITVAGAEVTAAAISLAPTLLAAAHGIATTTQPLSMSPLIWITFAYTQHIAMTIFFPGSLPDTYNTYASLFSWTIGMAPLGITFPFEPTNSTDGTTSNSSLKKGNGLSRKLLDVDDAVAEFHLSETQLLAAMLFWVLVLLLIAVAVVPLVMALVLTVQRNRLEERLNKKSGEVLSEQNLLVEKSPGLGSFTLQEANQSTQPDPGVKERSGLTDCLEIEASKPLDTRRSSKSWFVVCFLSSLVLVSASVLSLFYSSLLTLCATQILLPWTYEGNLGTVDKVMVALAIIITFVVGLGIPLWSAAAAYIVRSDKEPSIEKELSMVPSVRKFKARTAYFGLVIYGSLFANAWLVAVLQNQALAFYAASVLVQMFVFCGIFFTRPYKQKVVFAWQLVSSAAITLRLIFLTILMYQEGEGTSVSWVLVALPITLDTFVVCGTLLMSVKGFLIAIWRMGRSRCKSSRSAEDEDANL